MIRVAITSIVAAMGGYMISDGFHWLFTGRTSARDSEYGAGFLNALGVDPMTMGPAFAVLGALWLVFLVGTIRSIRIGWYGGLAVSISSIWYLPIGTVLSLVYAALLIRYRRTLTF